MTLGGWIFMTLSVGFVWGLALWCFRRVLSHHGTDRPQG